jgi:hypothetical protein
LLRENGFFSKVGFLSLIAMVINCTAQIVQESQKIDLVVAAAEKVLGVRDFSTDLQGVLREGVPSSQADGQVLDLLGPK